MRSSLGLPWILIRTLMTSCCKTQNRHLSLFHYIRSCVRSPPDRRHAKSFCMRDASRKNLTKKNKGPWAFQYLTHRRKSLFDIHAITALSLCTRFNTPVQLDYFNFLHEPSQLLNTQFRTQNVTSAYSVTLPWPRCMNCMSSGLKACMLIGCRP